MNVKLLLVGIFCTMISMSAFAQKNEKIDQYRVAFITNKLDLTSEESAAFWPIYNERTKKVQELRKSVNKSPSEIETLSDKDLDDYMVRTMEMQKQVVDINMEYYHKLKKAIPLRKIAKLSPAENEFKQFLIKKMQEMRQNRMNNNRQGMRGPKG